jgi:hypothetical protein
MRWLVASLVVLAAVTASCGGSKPQQPQVSSLSAQEREKIDRLVEMQQAAFEAQVRAALRSSCLKAKTVLLRDCKDLTATRDCRNLAGQARGICATAGMPIRLPRPDSVGCLGTGPFPAAPLATPPIRKGTVGILDNYTCSVPGYPIAVKDHSQTHETLWWRRSNNRTGVGVAN